MNRWISLCKIKCHCCLTIFAISLRLMGCCCLLTCLLSTSHTCSIGLTSVLFTGHGMTATLLSLSICIVCLAVWQGALSCAKVIPWFALTWGSKTGNNFLTILRSIDVSFKKNSWCFSEHWYTCPHNNGTAAVQISLTYTILIVPLSPTAIDSLSSEVLHGSHQQKEHCSSLPESTWFVVAYASQDSETTFLGRRLLNPTSRRCWRTVLWCYRATMKRPMVCLAVIEALMKRSRRCETTVYLSCLWDIILRLRLRALSCTLPVSWYFRHNGWMIPKPAVQVCGNLKIKHCFQYHTSDVTYKPVQTIQAQI